MLAHLLFVNTFSDFLWLGKDGVDEEVRGVVQDDLEIELEFPILRLSGFLNGAQTTRFYDLVGRTFLT
jgi:hypothetical protein